MWFINVWEKCQRSNPVDWTLTSIVLDSRNDFAISDLPAFLFDSCAIWMSRRGAISTLKSRLFLCQFLFSFAYNPTVQNPHITRHCLPTVTVNKYKYLVRRVTGLSRVRHGVSYLPSLSPLTSIFFLLLAEGTHAATVTQP
eukprot:1139936-Pelagomonas_calceolata.AAC.3